MPGTILILEHTAGDGPAHFGEWLTATGRPMRLVQIHAGDPVPRDLGDHAGVCVLGGPMSANDPLPHLHQELALIELALAADVPVIGHCLGAQLLAKALGAAIGRSPAPEIGWYPLTVQDTPAAREWFGAERAPWVMQWHREAFALPAGATPLAGSAACPQQAFGWRDRHLAVQCQPEAERDKIALWL
ncbi:MAG: type 1 glutamine amidotransferase, partial [Dehalococcoidia bacterium]